MLVPLVLAVLGAAVLGVGASMVFSWASGKSALWNIGFAAAVVLASAGILLIGVIVVMRQFAG